MIRNLNYFVAIVIIVLIGCKKDETKKPTPEPVTSPTITDFNPKSAMVGESVMITGANFGSDSNKVSVKFGSGSSVKPKSISNSEMSVYVPNGAQSGTIQITVGGKSVSTAASFSLKETPAPAPTITGFMPASAASGDSVIITGTGFGTDPNFMNVTFGKSPTAIKPKTTLPTKIVVIVPDDATTGDLSLSVNGGTAVKAKEQFTLKTLPLSITSLSASSGKVGAEVTVNGSGFGSDLNAVKVYFGGSNALMPTSVSGRQLVVTVPESASTGKVRVTLNSGATVTSASDFTVSLSLTSFSPKSGTIGDTIVVKGASFTNINDVSVYLNSASTTAVKPIKVSLHELAFKVSSLAKTGKIRITASSGSDVSKDDFTLQDQLRISDFYSPVSWDYVTDIRINSIVRIQGSFNTTDVNTIGVSFGGSSVVHPLMISGSDIYVGLPSDAKSGKLTVSMTGFMPFVSTKDLKILPVQKSGPWLRITDFVSTGRSNAMAFVIGSKVYVSGGQNQASLGTDYFGDLWEFDTSNGIWLKKSDFRGGVRYAGVSFTIGNTGYVGTGLDQSGNVKNDLWAYDASTNAWTQKADLPGESRGYAVGFTADGKGYVGTGLNSGKKPLNDFYRYDPSTNSWTQTASVSGARSQAFAFVINNKGYVGNGTGTSNLQMYDPSTNTWTAKAGIPSYTSIGGAAFSINGKGYAGLGMQNTTPDKRVYEYDPSSDTWTALPDMGAVSVGGVGFAVGNTGYFGLGGGYNGTAPGVDLWTYKP